MKKHKVRYAKGPIGKNKIIDDFLPKPKALVLNEESIKKMLSIARKASA